MKFWNSRRPGHATAPDLVTLVSDLPKKLREFTIYFPTDNNLVRFEIGLAPEARRAAPAPYRLKRPVVVYGTSVT